ncbi:hypothetical protein NUU61_005247 [Penicillium alfredii]|uniref:Uncharacterized protein n=1 Tax=Penicillium alfredii TaxID=1506179 RepID=A0A9W9F975_9EURO|nr:uncharacterized protein NUU61_005247 [Penicillium alfredii]KAJ5095891.1 hypothetical protein NUU61_005247 [Penicillium alfredii]
MSIPEGASTNLRNSTTANSLSRRNLSQIPRSSRTNVDRFARAPSSEGPYFAGARMQERSSHLVGLSTQLSAMDEIFRSGS